jgi:lipopolysaccharide biosynthesis regulator YciM
MKRNQFKLAEKWLDRGLEVDANSAQLLLLKGDLLHDSGSDTVAVSFYRRAMHDPVWERIAQQRIWNVIPPETEEEKLKKAFFGGSD